jgi:hypothetical protein
VSRCCPGAAGRGARGLWASSLSTRSGASVDTERSGSTGTARPAAVVGSASDRRGASYAGPRV